MFGLFKKRRSIYRQIASGARKKGWLSDDFTLLYDNPGRKLETAPGESDAAFLNSDYDSEPGGAAFEQFMKLIKEAQEDKTRKKDHDIAVYLAETHILMLIDRLCEEIYYEDRGIDLLKLLDAAFYWASESKDLNMVKLGISLLGMLNVSDREDCRDLIVTLGKYEEFTLYSLYAVSGWDDATEIAKAYAHNLKGWGKTHAELWLGREFL